MIFKFCKDAVSATIYVLVTGKKTFKYSDALRSYFTLT